MRTLAVVVMVMVVSLAFAQDFPEFERPWDDWEPPLIEMPEPNAYHLYRMAFDMLEEFEYPEQDATDEEVRASIEGFDLAYQALQQAMMGECRFPPVADPEQVFPELASTRNACRFMVTHAKVAALDGDMSQAALDSIACVRIGSAAAGNGTLIGGLVAIACEAIGLDRGLADIIPALQPDECRVAIEALRLAEAELVPLSEVLRGEMLCGKMLMKRQFRDIARPEDVERQIAALPPEQRAEALRQWEQMKQAGQLWTPSNSWHKHEEWLGQLIEETQKPYWAREQAPLPGDPMVDMLVGVYAKTQVKFAIADAHLRLALCRLAAQGYMVENGGPPQNLDALVPDWLPHVPDDPFRDAPIASTMVDGRFLMYSVGPDMVDNGGMGIEGHAREDSEGDMVVAL